MSESEKDVSLSNDNENDNANDQLNLDQLKSDFKFALDNDDALFVEKYYHYNFIESLKLIKYTIVENLYEVFLFLLKNMDLKPMISAIINLAIYNKNPFFINKLLDKYNDYDLNIPLNGNKSIIYYTHLNMAIYEKKMDHISSLLSHGAKIDVSYPSNKNNSLHLSILVGHQGIVKMLLENSKTDHNIINSINKQLNTPLHLATITEDLNLINLLIDYGADPNLKNREGYTILDIINQKIDNEKSPSFQKSKEYEKIIQIKDYLEKIGAKSTFFTI
jgi:hypothetical protein